MKPLNEGRAVWDGMEGPGSPGGTGGLSGDKLRSDCGGSYVIQGFGVSSTAAQNIGGNEQESNVGDIWVLEGRL